MPKICPRYAQVRHMVCQRCDTDMTKLFLTYSPRYVRYDKIMPKVETRYSQDIPKRCPGYIWKYAQDIPKIGPKYAQDLHLEYDTKK